MSAEMENYADEFEDIESKKSYPCDFGSSLYVVIPFCALISTFLCTGGWRSGLRATLLGAGLLLGILFTKRFCPSDAGVWRRLEYFIPAGILGGLLSALLIWSLELWIGSPTLDNNPYNQDGLNLFWICPLYGFFVLGLYGLALKLSRMASFFVVASGAAIANTFCLADMAYNPDLLAFIQGVAKNCVIYYIPCLGNSLFYVFLFNSCADSIYGKSMRKTGVLNKILTIILLVLLVYLGVVIIGLIAFDIKLERFVAQNKNTVFKEKVTGFIVIPKINQYYDFLNKKFYDFPEKFEINNSYAECKDGLQLEGDRNKIKIKVLNNGEVIKEISHSKDYGTARIVNNNIYYMSDQYLFRLSPPNYDKPELLLKDFGSYNFEISPDEKFVARYDLIHGGLGRVVLSVMNLKSKKILAVKRMGFFPYPIFWVNDLNDIRIKHEAKNKK